MAPGPGAVLFGRTRRRVLGWLFGHADQAFYLREIVRRTGAAQGAVQRELSALTRAGLIRRTMRGRQVYFEANREAPVFAELQGLILKTVGVVDVVRDALAPVARRIVAALVFGSAARGDLRSDSDIDLLVIGDVPFAAVVDALSTAQARLGRDVNPTVYPLSEFRAKIRGRHHFLTTVLAEPRVFIIGSQHELERLGAERLADGTSVQPGGDPRSARRRRARSRR